MKKEKIIDAIYVIIFIVGVVFLIYFMSSKSIWFLFAGLASWGLMPVIDEVIKKFKLNNDEKASE